MTEEHLFDEIKRYVGFGVEDEALLQAIGPRVKPHIHRIIDDFYDHILNHPDASRSLDGGQAQVERLKVTLRAWMERLFIGPWDLEYYELRARIGRRHVQINLPQQYMFTAVNVIRGHILGVLLASSKGEALAGELHAVNRLLDIELAVMLHTYREDYLSKVQRNERLATFGQLIASIAHELRNPLGVMESSLFLLRSRVGSEPKVSAHLDKIETQIKLSNRIISDLLDIVRERPPRLQAVELRALVSTASEAFSEQARSRLGLELAPSLPRLRADPDQVRQIIVNLLSNAFDAAGAAGEVKLLARAEERFVLLVVSDSGPGIDPAIRVKLFEPLVTTKSRGIGLGLALSRKLAERNGGSLTLGSGPLQGAAFQLRLPSAEA